MEKTVKIIQPIRKKVLQELKPKLKVCAYCRVSTDSTKQHTSYIAQPSIMKAISKQMLNGSSLVSMQMKAVAQI